MKIKKYYIVVLLGSLLTSGLIKAQNIVEQKSDDQIVEQEDQDDFFIDFDALDEELERMELPEPNQASSWKIVEHMKQYATSFGIKLLLGYIALSEYTSDAWQACKRRVQALLIGLRVKKSHEAKQASVS